MKIENLKKVQELIEILVSVDDAIFEATEFLAKFKKEISGHDVEGKDALYSFQLCQHQDGSGYRIDLTNCGIGIAVVKHTLAVLTIRRDSIVKEIESL